MRYIIIIADCILFFSLLSYTIGDTTFSNLWQSILGLLLIFLNVLFLFLRSDFPKTLDKLLQRFKIEQEIKLIEAQKRLSEVKETVQR
jgi:hypothetical protein